MPKLASEAQKRVMEKALADPEYARTRGISPVHAQALLDEHKASGSPALPERTIGPGRLNTTRQTSNSWMK